MNAEHCKAYTLLQEQQIDDIHAHGYLLRHNKSGARVLLLENEDDNKVFNIAFRTPPADSTGVIGTCGLAATMRSYKSGSP